MIEKYVLTTYNTFNYQFLPFLIHFKLSSKVHKRSIIHTHCPASIQHFHITIHINRSEVAPRVYCKDTGGNTPS